MTRPGAAVEPAGLRRGRFAVAFGSLLCTLLVAASALGFLPNPGATDVAVARTTAAGGSDSVAAAPTTGSADGEADGGAHDGALLGTASGKPVPDTAADPPVDDSSALPPGSGHGERVVFDESTQHVWLVSASGAVLRDYPVSGSVVDNLSSGSYQVYSRSRHATSFDLSSTMEFMVRFTEGSRAAIGFHSIPVDPQGERLQTREELGTPQSSGCIRQRRSDAVALWRFADVGTPVVVV